MTYQILVMGTGSLEKLSENKYLDILHYSMLKRLTNKTDLESDPEYQVGWRKIYRNDPSLHK